MSNTETPLNINIPSSMHRRLKTYCVIVGTTMKDVTILALQQYLNEVDSERFKSGNIDENEIISD